MVERSRGNVLSIEAVKSELEDPDISQWARANAGFFQPDDVSRLGDVASWVMSQPRFRQDAKVNFLAKADPRVIAFALARGDTVVTQEVSAPDSQASVKIPDVCIALHVDCQNTFFVLNQLRARFILEVNP